jgi:hypothetical protein
MPSPEVREGGHSLWEMWREAARSLEHAFAPTQPSQAAPVAPLAPAVDDGAAPPSSPAAPVLHPLKAEVLMVAARYNNRVCPLPGPWALLYETLGGARSQDLRPPPVQAWQWAMQSPLQKRLHFREHIEWAARHRRLKPVALFMKGLQESDWLHMGES